MDLKEYADVVSWNIELGLWKNRTAERFGAGFFLYVWKKGKSIVIFCKMHCMVNFFDLFESFWWKMRSEFIDMAIFDGSENLYELE